jgi:putative ABC transport system permease protein
MFKNYFITAWRNFWKNRTFSLINTTGLALGMACSLFIMLWVTDEKSIDAFLENKDRLFSIYENQYYDKKVTSFHSTPGVLPAQIKKDIPEIEFASGMAWTDKNTFASGDKIIKFTGTSAGEDLFNILSFKLLAGNKESALKTPVSLAISRKMAEAFFGSAPNAIGKTIRYENKRDLKVTAVFDDMPVQSSLKVDFFTNWELFLENNSWAKEWTNNGPKTLVLLKANADPSFVERKIKKYLDRYNKEQNANFYIELGLQRYDQMYLHNLKEGRIEGGRIEYVNLFRIVALFILIIACINFMNLTTARSVKRSREIGIRKVVGAVRPALIKQFLGEAIMMALLALLIALFITASLLPLFNQVTAKEIIFPVSDLTFWTAVLSLTIITGLIAGSYPALFLSSFDPISVLKGHLRFGVGAGLFRKGLVVFQFALSTILIIGTIVVSRQINFIRTTNLGYNRLNLVYITFEGDLANKYPLIKQRALQMPGIGGVTRMTQNPTLLENGTGGVDWEGKDPNLLPMFTQASVGYDFVKTMNVTLAEGRDFSRDLASDSSGFLINETAARKMNYKVAAGKPLTFWGKKGYIIGVIKDFHFSSLHLPIEPLILRLQENETWGTMLVRTRPGKTREALASLQKLCKEYNAQFPFTYDFADEEYKKLYTEDQTVGDLSAYFAFLAIFISCLGLLGLTIFTAEQRIKEMGIRKVLGASISTLFTLLSREFLLLVCLSLIIAFPLAWWMMTKWLAKFSYGVSINWSVFFFAAITALLIALSTISFHAIKAALANPAKSLRTE